MQVFIDFSLFLWKLMFTYVCLYLLLCIPRFGQSAKQNLAIFNAKIHKELKILEYSVSTLKEEVNPPTDMFFQNRRRMG